MSEMSSRMELDSKYHTFNDVWTMWAHLPHDTDWSIKSYKKIMDITCVESIFELEKIVPDVMIQNCMLFCMRKNIIPTWEDVNNRDGGSFSFKISNSNIYQIWNEVLMNLTTEMLINDEIESKSINGITVSPKKNFCIMKIWMKDINIQDINKFNLPSEIDSKQTLFKRHIPED